MSKFDTPHTSAPKTQLLSNGRYSLMVTNAGGGYSRWGDHEITRWRSDRTEDRWGTFCYIREADSDRVWSNTYHPVGGKAETYSASFALDRAVFRRVDGGIHTDTEVVVSPEDDVEIRRITLVNRSVRTRRLELTSYVELAMAPHGADLQHPAFSKLFIATEAVRERARSSGAPPVSRRRRSPHLRRAPPDPRGRRGRAARVRNRPAPLHRSRADACQAHGDLPAATDSQGFVLDPILCLRQRVTLHPAQRVQVTLVRRRGGDPRAGPEARGQVRRCPRGPSGHGFRLGLGPAGVRLLRIQPDEARRFQHLASYLLYPNPLLRPSAECIEENRKGQAGLWPYGISGDLPIALVTIGEARDIALVRQMLEAHTYWRKHGLDG